MYDFNKIINLNKDFKSCLAVDFGLIYIEKKEETATDNRSDNRDLSMFDIPKERESLFVKITSADKLSEIKNEFKEHYAKFSNDFLDYFERVEAQLNGKDKESFEIIEKTIKNRGRKLNSTIDKFKIEDNWNVSKIQEEFYFKLQKNLKDIIDSLIQPIATGIRENTAYDGILIDFNKFLSNIGIYTVKFDKNQKTDNHLLEPQPCDDCKTENVDKKDTIKEILSYPYVLNNEQIISEGRVILWQITYN